ncbi:hypothetical protein [Kitasatospora sp. NPDC094015]|uniref:hypothetical protein n=1 Tax=Kitasatospora sp. NPDC094015 TaxID=3155205 RepID=UPI003325730E
MRSRILTAGAALAAALLASGCTASGTGVTAEAPASPTTGAPAAAPPSGEPATLPPTVSLAPAVSAPPPGAPASTRRSAPAPSTPPPPFAAPHVSAIRVDGPCGLNGHTYEADFVITLEGGQGWQIKPQSGQRVRPDGKSMVYRYGLMLMDWPPAPETLIDGKVRVGYPLGDDGMQVTALADGSVHAVVVPAELRATIDCTP